MHAARPLPVFSDRRVHLSSLFQKDRGIGEGQEEMYGMKTPNYPVGSLFGRLSWGKKASHRLSVRQDVHLGHNRAPGDK